MVNNNSLLTKSFIVVRHLLLFVFLIYFNPLLAQKSEAPTFRLFLIGDAGEGDTTGATLNDLGLKLKESPNSAVVFLGDNCYVRSLYGLLKLEVGGYDGSKTAQSRIMSQLNILRGYKGSVFFIPGNHDWYNHIDLKKGKRRLLAEQKFIEDTLRKFITIKNHDEGTFIPTNGDPGPISKNFNDEKTRIIFIDSYRLIIEEGRKRKNDSLLLKNFYSELESQLKDATSKHQKIVVVAHHPIHAKGKHSLPLIFWERINRRFADANTNYPPYNKMSTHLDSLLKKQNHPDIYYVSGHEHSLEYFFNDSMHYLISGAGSRVDDVKTRDVPGATDYFIWNEEGFYEIAFYSKYEKVLMYHRKDNNSELEVHCLEGCE
jgi:hypothetical protein